MGIIIIMIIIIILIINTITITMMVIANIIAANHNESFLSFYCVDVHFISTINGGLYCPICAGIHRELGIHPDFLALNNDIKFSNEDMQVINSFT